MMASESQDNLDMVNEIYSYTVDDEAYEVFIEQHKPQLLANNIPDHFWKPLCIKLKNEIFDAGNVFLIIQHGHEESGESISSGVLVQSKIDLNDGLNIYLIDHAWTYKATDAKRHLMLVPGLVERMAKLMNLALQSDNLVDDVYKEMWKYNQTYSYSSLVNIEDQLPAWYIMDEFGSAISHSDEPNFRSVPFLHIPEGLAYSLLFPIKHSEKGDIVSRDYVEGTVNDIERKVKLIPWFSNSFRSISHIQEEPSEEYFLSVRRNETLPDFNALIPKVTNGSALNDKPLKVFSQYSYINEYLKNPKFIIVGDEDSADILWLITHFKQFKEFSQSYPTKFINQFPFECVITIKDLLAIVCRRKINYGNTSTHDESICETSPAWLPITYNLVTELTKFVSYFQFRQEKGLDNHWICKPWNLARGMDMIITDNLNCIIRLSSSGPKIAQKYIEDPILFYRDGIGSVKFDIRYVILLKSVQPLELYIYKNFFLRFANKPFELSDFEDYEKHFTVMNYNESANLHRLLCADFIREFNIQYPDNEWSTIEPKIMAMFKLVFECAIQKEPPCGIGRSPQSRALYAADIMLSKNEKGDFVPELLEINWTPDCQRACEYYPDFYNDIFELLFYDEEKPVFYRLS